MNVDQITQIIRHTLFTALEVSAPFLLLALIVGILVCLFQAVFRMQEQTLSFVPKMLTVALALAIFFPWMVKMLVKFTNNLWVHQWDKVTNFVNYVR